MPYRKKANSCAMKGKAEYQAPRARDTSRHCHRSADWQSAVSRIGNPPTCRIPFGETADCQSALQASLDPYLWQCQDAPFSSCATLLYSPCGAVICFIERCNQVTM